jgi:DNA-binding transcriptional regulator YhcF (GntR family)
VHSVNIDHESPVPLYHQLVEAIRYRIATGGLKPGSLLPPLRRAAETWGVNLHTVRRAYAELSRLGVVETSVPTGTRVKSDSTVKPERMTPAARGHFLQSIVSEARLRHGLSVDELVRHLRDMKPAAHRPGVAVVECSRTQCDDLAGQLETRWRVQAEPWTLQNEGALPHGLIVATYFHYNDVRQRWPTRLSDVRFLAIAPETDLATQIRRRHRRTRGGGRRITVVLCEREDSMARNIAADLGRILPAQEFNVVTKVVSRAEACLAGQSARTPILLSPRMWGELPARLRDDPRVHQVRYVFDPSELDGLAHEQGWEAT